MSRFSSYILASCILSAAGPSPAAVENQAPAGLLLDYAIENTNILNYLSSGSWQDFNRLRLDSLTTLENFPEYSLTLIGDGKILYDTEDNRFETDLLLYRAYGSYEGEKITAAIGRQRIPFGVGRIWNPVDIFNPIDSTSIEPDEREGTDSLRVEYSLSDLAIMDATISAKKGAFRTKGYLAYADIALIGQYDDENDQIIAGWEIEGEFPATGIELRSEGGIYYDRDSSRSNVQAIIGGEYGFPNSLTLIVEYLHDGSAGDDSLGLSTSYQLDMLTIVNGLVIVNLDDSSFLIAPSASYSLSDEMTLDFGMFIYGGGGTTQYGETADSAYLRWFVHF